MGETKFIDRVKTFFWWNVMSFGWFIGIFSKKIYTANENWLKTFAKKYRKV